MHAIQPAPPKAFTEGLAPDWRRYSFDWQAGRPAAIIVAPGVAAENLASLLAAFGRAAIQFATRGADVLILAETFQAQALRSKNLVPYGLEIITCDDTFLADSGAASGEIMVVVVDRTMRVALRCPPGPAEDITAASLACLASLTTDIPPPVLILPNLLPPNLCRSLMARFEAGDSIEGKVSGIDAAGLPRSYVDHAQKKRRDLQIQLGDPLHKLLRTTLLARCTPEIAKAFQVEIAHTDRLMLARYDSPGGWFRRHRDNAAGNVAFRQFAITVNLNSEDCEGGGLVFPEFSDRQIRPPTGAAVIFSASLLHEVAVVSQGSRYALLTFFHSDAAERQRHADEARILAARLQAVPA